MAEKTYDIGGKKYVQRALVLGQIRQLVACIEGVVFPEDLDPRSLIITLGDRLPRALAIVLTPENTEVRGKDLEELAEEIEFSISPEAIFEVIEDFFDCNPIVSLLESVGKMSAKIQTKLPTGSKSLSASSPEATSPDENQSSGETPQENAIRTSDTEIGS